MSNPVTKYDTLIKTLQTEVVSDVNSILLSKFQPIIKEITNDISIFNLIEKLDCLVKELPVFKELESKYNALLENHKLLVDSLNNSPIQLEIKDIEEQNITVPSDKPVFSDNSKKNIKIPTVSENDESDSESSISDDETDSESELDDPTNNDSNVETQPVLGELHQKVEEDTGVEVDKEQETESDVEGEEEEGEELDEVEEEEAGEEEAEEEEEEDEEAEEEEAEEEEGEEEEEEGEEEEEEEGEEEEEEEEFELIEIQGKEYFTNNEKGGDIYTCVDDDIGDKVGYFDDNGIAHFNKKK